MRNSALTWSQIIAHLSQHPAQACMKLEKWRIEHPLTAGMKRSIGIPVGQFADWRFSSPNCHGLHVREFSGHYTVHIDRVNPNCHLPGHIATDAPAVGGGAALGALVGLLLGESVGAFVVGALIGGAIGASVASASESVACARPVRPRP